MEWLWLAFFVCVIAVFVVVGLKWGLSGSGSFTSFLIFLFLLGVSVFGTIALYHPHIPYFLFFLVPAPILLGAMIGTCYRWVTRRTA